MFFLRRSTAGFTLKATVAVTAAALLLSGCAPDSARNDDLRQQLSGIVGGYLAATSPAYRADQALISGEIPDLYSSPDENRTVWMGYLTTTTGSEFVSDPQWQKTLDYLQNQLRMIIAGDGELERGEFDSGADRVDRIAALIPTEKFSQDTQDLLAKLLTREQQKLGNENTLASIADEALLLRASSQAGLSGIDTEALKNKVLDSGLLAQATSGSLEAIRAGAFAGNVLSGDPEISALLEAELPDWVGQLSETPLSAETAPILLEVRALAVTLGLEIDIALPANDPNIVAFGSNWVGSADTSEPDPQLTFYWRSLGLLEDAVDWKSGALPNGGWMQPVTPTLLGTATSQILQKQFTGASPSSGQLDVQRKLIESNLGTLTEDEDISAAQATSFLAAAADYQLSQSEQQKLEATALKTIQQALDTQNYLQAASAAATIENFGIDPGSLRSRLDANIPDTPQETLTDQYALEYSRKFFGQDGATLQPDFSTFTVEPGAIPPENPQRLTDVALVAKVGNWQDEEKYAALESFINQDTNQLCAFSDCRQASVSAPDLLALSFLSKPTVGALTTPRIL